MALAGRRCVQLLIRHSQCLRNLTTVSNNLLPSANRSHGPSATMPLHEHYVTYGLRPYAFQFNHHFCSKPHDEDKDESSEGKGSQNEVKSVAVSADGKEKEAAEIGYRVIGPLKKSDRVFKRYRPVFAVVQIGSHQFKVSNDDCIYTEKLKYCDVNDKLLLNKVLLLDSKTQTIIGRPLLPNAAVHAVVEEHALDAKVIVFKKKRRKNYRRKNGHRQELTKLRITRIEGIEVPEDIKTPSRSEKKQKPETLPHLKVPLEKDGLEALSPA